MDQNISSTPGADVTLPGPENPHFFQVARSSHPNPVTQLLQQILTLRDELNHERQQHAAEHKKTRDKYEADLQLLRGVKGNLEKNLKHMEEKYKEDLTCTLKKVEYLEGDWTALQTRASELRSEVDTLGVAVAVRQSLSVVPQQREDTVDQVDERSGSKVPSEWQLERTEFLNRHKALEERLVIQRSESAQVLQETRVGLGSIIVEYNEITKKLVDRKAAVEALQACQESKVDYNTPQSICWQHGASSKDVVAAPETIQATSTTAAGHHNSTSDLTTDAHINSTMTEKPHKRTLSKLMDDGRDASLTDHQRRRTGFASYVGITNPTWQAGATLSTAEKGFASTQGDFQDARFLSHENRSKSMWGEGRTTNDRLFAPGPYFSKTEVPLATVSSQQQALVSLPPSPAKDSFRCQEVTSDSSEDGNPSSQVLHLRSNTQGQSPWKVPVGPRKWRNSAFRKNG